MTTFVLDTTNPIEPGTPTLTGNLDATGTAQALTDFLTAWHRVDPNGTWDPANIYFSDDAMAYIEEHEAQVFPRNPGASTYALNGWDLTPACPPAALAGTAAHGPSWAS